MNGSPLTALQKQFIHQDGVLDLSVGYPKIQSMHQQWAHFRNYALQLAHKPPSQFEAVESLMDTVRLLLDIPSGVNGEVTLSGSVAIERAMTSMLPLDRETVVTVPGFDAIPAFVKQATKRPPRYLYIDPFRARSNYIDQILESINHSTGALVLVSPDNPSGFALNPLELQEVASACANTETLLVIDQCFCRVNPFSDTIGSAFNLGNTCRWVALWDTSKTVELLGERLGFIFCPSPDSRRISRGVEEIQFEIPVMSAALINIYLRELSDTGELGRRDTLVRNNYHLIEGTCIELNLMLNRPDAGGFATIGLPAGIGSIDIAQDLMLSHRVAVTPSAVLYPDAQPRQEFLRVALLRPTETIQQFIDALHGASSPMNLRNRAADRVGSMTR